MTRWRVAAVHFQPGYWPVFVGRLLPQTNGTEEPIQNAPSMKRLLLNAALLTTLALGGLVSGCSTTSDSHAGHSHDTKAPSVTPAPQTGLACTQCTCRKFETRVEDANVCRMCWHPLAAHTR